eukprot:3842339-Pleurochrysis_carterae.AAC.1
MDVRWARRSVDAFVGEEFKSSHHTCRGIASFIEKSRETGEKKTNVLGCFVLVSQHVNGLESGVIVNEDERVTTSSIDGGKERSGDVHVNETAGMRRLAAHEGGKAWRRLCGASAVRFGSCLSCAPPQ